MSQAFRPICKMEPTILDFMNDYSGFFKRLIVICCPTNLDYGTDYSGNPSCVVPTMNAAPRECEAPKTKSIQGNPLKNGRRRAATLTSTKKTRFNRQATDHGVASEFLLSAEA